MPSSYALPGNSQPNQAFLNTVEAAAYLGLQRTTLEAWRCRGGGPKYLKFGNAVRYRRADLEAWIESRTRSHTSETEEV